MNGKLYFIAITFLFLVYNLNAQDPTRFQSQIKELVQKEHQFEPGKKLALFTGSSSVLMWKDVADYFPEFNVINNGFGGSHFSDLIHYYEKLIPKYNPDYLFIYEGDNDIASDKKPGKILKEAKLLVDRIQRDLPETKLVLISPKPSVARWHLRKNYEKLNKKLERLANKTDNLEYADVWNAMLDENGQVFTDVFLDDNLHMNKKGYDIWGKVIQEHLE
ncbi:GDSL-type esterase/lipase family protein [Mariniphaga sp.]|uniref:GDSL-type esterase/lipase family protein n=1 Tax=Mariniphaga sp. TaxID=1954475 RepID=UPI003564E667